MALDLHGRRSVNQPKPPTIQDQIAAVVNDIMEPLRRLAPDLQQTDDRIFSFLFKLEIRNGHACWLNIETWDSTFQEVLHKNARSASEQFAVMEDWLVKKFLPTRFIPGYYGFVHLRVSVNSETASFSVMNSRQKKYPWVAELVNAANRSQ